MATKKEAKVRVPAWMQHGVIINCPEGKPPEFISVGLDPDQLHDLAVDMSVATRRADNDYRRATIVTAFESGIKAERQRVETERAASEESTDATETNNGVQARVE